MKQPSHASIPTAKATSGIRPRPATSVLTVNDLTCRCAFWPERTTFLDAGRRASPPHVTPTSSEPHRAPTWLPKQQLSTRPFSALPRPAFPLRTPSTLPPAKLRRGSDPVLLGPTASPILEGARSFAAVAQGSSNSRASLARDKDWVTQRALEERRRSKLKARWAATSTRLLPHSAWLQSIASSAFKGLLMMEPLRNFAASTLERYFDAWQKWESWCALRQVSAASPALVQVLDFLVESLLAAREDRREIRSSLQSFLKAMRWMSQTHGFEILLQHLSHASVRSVAQRGQYERREALPLPWSAIVLWEKCIMQDNTPVFNKLVLGGFLIATLASLRWGDVQRIHVSSLVVDTGFILRGLCYKTKTTRTGQPFAAVGVGLVKPASVHGWLVSYLTAVQSTVQQARSRFGVSFDPDFLVPADHAWSRPMSYAEGLQHLRQALTTCQCDSSFADLFPSSVSKSFTLHSLKVCVLSTASQIIEITENARAAQGHHRPSVGFSNPSVRLYSRDDVFAAIHVQQTVLSKLASGHSARKVVVAKYLCQICLSAQRRFLPMCFRKSSDASPASAGFFRPTYRRSQPQRLDLLVRIALPIGSLTVQIRACAGGKICSQGLHLGPRRMPPRMRRTQFPPRRLLCSQQGCRLQTKLGPRPADH